MRIEVPGVIAVLDALRRRQRRRISTLAATQRGLLVVVEFVALELIHLERLPDAVVERTVQLLDGIQVLGFAVLVDALHRVLSILFASSTPTMDHRKIAVAEEPGFFPCAAVLDPALTEELRY